MFLFNPARHFDLHLKFELTTDKSVLRKKHRGILQLHHFIIWSTLTMYKCWTIEVSPRKKLVENSVALF